jgi:hypothetical protein
VSRAVLDEVVVGDSPGAWEALGFALVDGVVPVGGVRIRPTGEGGGILSCSFTGLESAEADGLPVRQSTAPRAAGARHPLGVTAVDHVVALTPRFAATVETLRAAGFDYRPTRGRQAFFVAGPCLLELVGDSDGEPRFWGLTLVADDLDAAAAHLGDRVGAVKDAVQPGRRIATLRRGAGLSVPIALMSPRAA